MTDRAAFTPIEQVVAEAEQRAQAEWDREHEPCPHLILDTRLCDPYPRCGECGALLPQA